MFVGTIVPLSSASVERPSSSITAKDGTATQVPNKLVHRNLSLTATAIATTTFIVLPPDMATAFVIGSALTVLPELTPDLDISTRKFSPLQQFLGLESYAKLVPHRYGVGQKHWSRLRIWHIFFFSHMPLIGTLLRTLLCTLPLLLLAMLFGITNPGFWQSVGWYWLSLWLGMSWSDCWHVGADLLVSDFKETGRELWYGRKTAERRLFRKTGKVE